MNSLSRSRLITIMLAAGLAIACGGAPPPVVEEPAPTPEPAPEPPPRESPPESAEPRDISFPDVERSELSNGLELNTVRWDALPIVYISLVIDSGAATDPADRQGLAQLVASMMKEGTRRRSSAELAEEVDFLGADIWTSTTADSLTIGFRALSDQLDQAMEILADVSMNPAFSNEELEKLKRRERNRLTLMSSRPGFLARRTLYGALYGDHPYGRVDTTTEVVDAVSRRDMVSWHRAHVVPNNGTLIVVGDVTAEQVQQSANTAFRRWRRRNVPEIEYPTPPERDAREVIIVDRPGSVQSTIYIGNICLERGNPDWIPFIVANQVLGGSAASRLFMDLREERSLTYGAYSGVGERVHVAPFRASAEVRTEVTGEAMSAFFEHLNRIVTEAAPAEEIVNAQRFLSDSFPLQIDTPGKIGNLISELRLFNLADDYWDTYRTRIGEVDAAQALTAARAHIDPEHALIVIVGDATSIQEGLRAYGPVQVLNTEGETLRTLEAQPAAEGE